jgi:hypothetical protein
VSPAWLLCGYSPTCPICGFGKPPLRHGCAMLRSRCAVLRLANSQNGFGISTPDQQQRWVSRRWPVWNALGGSASPIKHYTRLMRFSKLILSAPYRLRSVQTVVPAFSSRTASCVPLRGWQEIAFRSTGATRTKVRALTAFLTQIWSSPVTARSISWLWATAPYRANSMAG